MGFQVQPKLYDIMVRFRTFSYVLIADIVKDLSVDKSEFETMLPFDFFLERTILIVVTVIGNT